MRVTIDTDAGAIDVVEPDGSPRRVDLYSPEGFSLLSHLWVVTGWDQKYTYGFAWMGRPVIQLPEDMVVIQEVIYRTRPDVIIETGVAHGGSLVFYASLLKAMGGGSVIGVDIEIRPHNRTAIEAHELFDHITLIEGGSTEPAIVEQVRAAVAGAERVMVVLDSNHTKAHVLAELDAYSGLVTEGCYLVATDGVMEWVADVPRGTPAWRDDNPKAAVESWLPGHPEFVLEEPPPFTFNEGPVTERVTHWPSAYLRRT